MGRPLHKRNFGPLSDAGPQIRVTAYFDSGPETAYIVRQKGTYWFVVKDAATNTKEMVGRLVAKDPASLNAGEICIQVDVNDGVSTFSTRARSIQAHRSKTLNTSNLTTYDVAWHYGPATTDRARLDNA